MNYLIKVIGNYPNNKFGLYSNDKNFINICKSFSLNSESFIKIGGKYFILSATSNDIDKLCAYCYYLSLINNNFKLDNDYDYEICYNNHKNNLREIWCPKYSHDLIKCKCPLYD